MDALTTFGLGIGLGYLVKALAHTADTGAARWAQARSALLETLRRIPEVQSVWSAGPWLIYVLVSDESAAHESGAYEEIVGAELTYWSFGSAELRVRGIGCVLPDGAVRLC